MIFAAAIPVGIVAGLLFGGRLEGLSALRFRWAPLAVGGLLAQVVLFSELAAGLNAGMVALLYVATTAAVFVALLRNVRLTGLPIVAFGALSNLAAIIGNGGIMPADAAALAAAGLEPGTGPTNSAVLADPVLQPLTDVFAIPATVPLANVFSIGDVLIATGLILAIVAAMRADRSIESDPG
ncbi:MAG: DUF5317 family protein [Chloroflexota bacterium]|mgnify:CR=1 FL=1